MFGSDVCSSDVRRGDVCSGDVRSGDVCSGDVRIGDVCSGVTLMQVHSLTVKTHYHEEDQLS